MPHEIEREKFMQVVETIRRQFPHLRTELFLEHPHVEAMLEIPAQDGLNFDVSINLQNCDELHLNAGSFWCEWFPCRKPDVFDEFVDAVSGLLSGSYRIVEYSRAGVSLKANLERPVVGNWKRVASWSRLHLPIRWGMSTRILQNVS
jgi:hypothetical protein